MLRRWLLYLVVFTGCLGFLLAYQQWYAWVILLAVLCLPLLGLVVSLPIMLTMKLHITLPNRCSVGDTVPVSGEISAPLGITRIRWRLQTNKGLQKPGSQLSTEHCGVLTCRPVRVRFFDCLGLFFRIPKKQPPHQLFVHPIPLPVADYPEFEQRLTLSWRPKPGGGLAENHELRLYRPGDSLNQIHWKLSAKTGKFIIREALVPLDAQAFLSLTLGGTPEEMDRKLGRLLWLGNRLLEKNFRFCIRARSGKQILVLNLSSQEGLLAALNRLLAAPPAAPDAPADAFDSPRLYTIGGEPDEG